MIKKSILSMVVIGLLGVNVVHAADKISKEKISEIMQMKKSNKQECIYEEPKENLEFMENLEKQGLSIEQKNYFIAHKLEMIYKMVVPQTKLYYSKFERYPDIKEIICPDLKSFYEKHIETHQNLKRLVIELDGLNKHQNALAKLEAKIKPFYDIYYRTTNDYSQHMIVNNDILPEFYEVLKSPHVTNNDILKYLPIISNTFERNKELFKNKELVFNVFSKFPELIYDGFYKEGLNNEKLMLELIKNSTIKEEYKKNKGSYISSIYSIKAIPNEMKNNEKVVYAFLDTLREYPNQSLLIEFVGSEMYKSTKFAEKLSEIKLSKWNIEMIDKFPSKIRNDDDIALNFVKNSGADALKYLSSELKDNKKFMLKCLKLDAKSYQYASDKLKEDDDIRAFKPYR